MFGKQALASLLFYPLQTWIVLTQNKDMSTKDHLKLVLDEYKRIGIAEQIDYENLYLYSLVTIHPWVDGNSRMSRLIMNHLQFEYGLVPTKVNKDDKAEYIQALIDSREQDTTEPFHEFMLHEHIKNLQQEIAAYQESIEVDRKQKKLSEKVDRKTD